MTHGQGSLQKGEFTWVLAKVSIPSHCGTWQQACRQWSVAVAGNSHLSSMLKTEEKGKRERGKKRHRETETKRQTVHGMSS